MPSSPEIGLISHADIVQPFMLHRSSVRGRVARLSAVLDEILTHHENPPAVNKLLGELLTLAALLSSSLPENGILTLQAKGNGPLRLLVVDAVHGGALRGYADLAEGGAAAIEAMKGEPGLSALMGQGYLAITLDMGYGDPYQGIVPLEGDSLTEAVKHYFTQSQQIDVLFNLHVGRRIGQDGTSGWAAGGIMLERMPDEGGHKPSFAEDGRTLQQTGKRSEPSPEMLQGWEYNALLVGTATEEELLDPHLAPSALLYRLFNEGGVWVHDTKGVSAECRCSRQKIAGVLGNMGDEAIEAMKVDGVITVTCQFCNTTEVFADGDWSAPSAASGQAQH